MKYHVVKQKPPYTPYTKAVEFWAFKKKVYVRGWSIYLQVGQRAWRVLPRAEYDKIGPNPDHRKG